MAPRTVLLATILVLLAGLTIVPAASAAVKASIRVEASAYQVAPWTAVSVPSTGSITDSATPANTYPVTHASALGALAKVAQPKGFTFVTGFGGDYVSAIAGLDSWMYAVNGAGFPNIDVGAFTFTLLAGDKVVFYQSPVFTPDSYLLAVRVAPSKALLPGQAATFTVVGDALSAPNSNADADRFKVSPSTVVAPAAFPAITGATLHIGNQVYVDGADGDALDGTITVDAVPAGTTGVWAEKATDAQFTYVRSTRVLVNVSVAPKLSRVVARPNPFVPGVDAVHVAFDLSEGSARAAHSPLTFRCPSGCRQRGEERRKHGSSHGTGAPPAGVSSLPALTACALPQPTVGDARTRCR